MRKVAWLVGICALILTLLISINSLNLNEVIYCDIIGWENGSWGYHGNNGDIFCHSRSGKPYGPLFTTGDIVGCCLNFINNTVFYTKNGVHLGNYYDTNSSHLKEGTRN